MRPGFRRRALSMTSLIDVIFLLLMFFMLATSFTKTADLPISARGSGSEAFADARLSFLRISQDALLVNGRPVAPQDLAEALMAQASGGVPRVLVSIASDVSAQRLADLLALLRALPDAAISVMD